MISKTPKTILVLIFIFVFRAEAGLHADSSPEFLKQTIDLPSLSEEARSLKAPLLYRMIIYDGHANDEPLAVTVAIRFSDRGEIEAPELIARWVAHKKKQHGKQPLSNEDAKAIIDAMFNQEIFRLPKEIPSDRDDGTIGLSLFTMPFVRFERFKNGEEITITRYNGVPGPLNEVRSVLGPIAMKVMEATGDIDKQPEE